MLTNTREKVTYDGYNHARCLFLPVTRKVIEELITKDLYDPEYGELHNGLRGIYEAQLEDFNDGTPLDADRPISKLYVARLLGAPVGVAVVRFVRDVPGVDHILHLWVKPEFRNNRIGKELIYRIKTMCNIPGLGMHETELSKPLFVQNRSITPLRRPTRLDHDFQRCLRTLDYTTDWTDSEGSLLCTGTILNTLKAQDELIKQLRKQINPHDNSILLS